MTDVMEDIHPVKQQVLDLLTGIATAATQHDAICLDYDAQTLMWGLEAHGTLYGLDIENLRSVFQTGLEQRLQELEQP